MPWRQLAIGIINVSDRLISPPPEPDQREAPNLGSIWGRPVALKLPLQKAKVRWLFAWRSGALAAHRARLLTVVATLGCLRVNEVARLQVCDLWYDYLMSYGVPGLEGTCSVHINRRKNDAQRKGHYPAFGRSLDPELDVVAQLRRWLPIPTRARTSALGGYVTGHGDGARRALRRVVMLHGLALEARQLTRIR